MYTAQEFFAREIRRINRAIARINTELEENPSANGRHDGMHAMLDIQRQHRLIAAALASQVADDMDEALHICRARLIVVQEECRRIADSGGADNLRCAEVWWQTLNEMHYLVSLNKRLDSAMQSANGHAPVIPDADEAEAWSWMH